jgi:hypothetical protein
MANGPPPIKPNGTSVLTALASSGDNWVKLMIVAGMILNVVMTNQAKDGVSANTKEIDSVRQEILRDVRVVFKNQKAYTKYLKEDRIARNQIMEKLGIAVPKPTTKEEDASDQEEENNNP